MKESVKILLVGVGGYGTTYLNPLLDNTDPRYILEGMVDPCPRDCKRLDEALQKGVPLYNSMAEFYAEHEADLTVISTPIHLHTPMIIEAMEHGSHVVCEKPLCGDDKDIEKLMAAQEKYGKYVGIGYQLSHSDAMTAFKQDILNGDFGEPVLLKTIILGPRDHEYYGRGIGWAGKMHAKNGALIRDSVANNATAHYLFNMFYVLGKDKLDSAIMPTKIETKAYKANNIESFDSAEIYCELPNGAKAVYLGTHATTTSRGPIFEYRFTKGKAILGSYNGKRQVYAEMNDGTIREYGDPFANSPKKMFVAADNILNDTNYTYCSIATAAVQTRIIAEVHNQHPEIERFPEELIETVEKNGKTYTICKGLDDKYNEIYDNL
nr:Gfo/Idh/MocA family oxidoreductase [Clostridia bacterium]